MEAVRTALQRQCEEGIIYCGYTVDTPEAFLETFELEQWEPVRFTRFPSEAELSFTFSDSLSLLVSEEAGLAQVQLGEWEWEKEEKVYRLPEGTAAAIVRYAQEHHCLGREESLARCEAVEKVSAADDQGASGHGCRGRGAAFPVDGGGVAKPIGAHGSLGPLCPAVSVGVLYRHLLAGYR